jgi:hypothetical protein
MHRFLKLLRIIGLLSAMAALSGCSAIKLGYNALPQLATFWVDGYLDLADEQEQRLRDDIARLHQWHRRHELPKFAALLQQAERLAADNVTPEAVCNFVPELRMRALALVERSQPTAVTLALNLGAEQLAQLERKYRKNNREYRKDWIQLSTEELRQKRLKQFVERTEMIYGSLDEAQRESIRRQLERSVFNPETNLAERERRQQDILQTLRQLAGQPVSLPDASAAIQRLVQRGMQSPDPRYAAYQETLIQEGCRSLATVHNSTTAQQRQNAVRRLRAYQRDLEELSAQR